MVASVIVVLIIITLSSQQYLKGGIVNGFIMLIGSILAACVALNYYEIVGDFGTSYAGTIAYPLVFALIFAFVMVLVIELSKRLLKRNIELGFWPDRIGGAVMGALAGYICAGAFVIVLSLLPFRVDWLYQRFATMTKPSPAVSPLLKPEAFFTGMYSYLSRATLNNEKSFSLVHADYVDQIWFDRSYTGITPVAKSSAIDVKQVIRAPDKMVGKERSGNMIIVSVAFNSSEMSAIETDGSSDSFGMGQFRVITVPKEAQADALQLKGKGTAYYPIGLINDNGTFEAKDLKETISAGEGAKNLVFNIPPIEEPVLVSFKDNVVDHIKLAATTKTKQQ